MQWRILENQDTLKEIAEASKKKPVLIFKHSTRCAISAMVINRLTSSWKDDEIGSHDRYYLDLITYRSISNQIERMFKVPHQSPQVLIIKDGRCIYDDSHMGINYPDVREKLTEAGSDH